MKCFLVLSLECCPSLVRHALIDDALLVAPVVPTRVARSHVLGHGGHVCQVSHGFDERRVQLQLGRRQVSQGAEIRLEEQDQERGKRARGQKGAGMGRVGRIRSLQVQAALHAKQHGSEGRPEEEDSRAARRGEDEAQLH